MPIRLIASAFGATALAALSDVVAELKAEDPMRNVTVLVPSNVVGLQARRHLARGVGGRDGVAAITVTTLPRLAEQLAAPHMGGRRPLTRAVLTSAFRAAISGTDGVFEPISDHPSTLRALVQAHRTLRGVSDNAAAAVAASGNLPKEVTALSTSVSRSLTSAWYDENDLLLVAGRLLSKGASESLGPVVLFLPESLTHPEHQFLQALVSTTEVTLLIGSTGNARADRSANEFLERAGLPLPAESTTAPTVAEVLHASDSDDEVRFVVRRIVDQLQVTRADRIAVLYSKAAPYARLLHEHLGAADVRTNGPGVTTVRDRGLVRGLMAILELGERRFERIALFDALGHAPVLTDSGDRAPAARWERIARKAGVVEAEDWDNQLTRYAADARARAASERQADDPEEWRITTAIRDAEGAEQLDAFVRRLRDLLDQGEATATWAELSEWSLRLFHELFGEPSSFSKLPVAEQYAAVVIEQALKGLGELGATNASASLRAARDILDADFDAARPRVGRFGEGVFVGPVSAARGLSFDVTFVLGLSEDLFPGRLAADPLLPDRARAETAGELLDAKGRVAQLHRTVLAAFGSAPVVIASFPRGDLRRSTPRLPSRWLLPSLRELSGQHDLDATKWDEATSDRITGSESFWAELRRTTSPASEQEWRLRAVAAGTFGYDDTVDAAVELLRARDGEAFTRFDGNLDGVTGLPDYLRSEVAVAPTTLESYAKCPHAYFMKRLLKADELEQPEAVLSIAPTEIGNLVHSAMDRLVTEFAEELPGYGQPWSTAQRSRFAQIALEVAKDAEDRGLTGHPLLWERDKQQLLRDLDAMLVEDDRFRAERRARVRSSELAFGMHGNAPVTVPAGDGRILMKGSADRVDETEDGVLIVTDIKTGSVRDFGEIKKDPVVGGTKLQLPVYALAAQQAYGGEQVEAAYWFVRKGQERIPVALDDDLRARYGETLVTIATSIAAGLFPEKAPKDPDHLFRQCPWCNPDGLGHGEVRVRYERKRSGETLAELMALIDPAAAAGEPVEEER